MGRDESGMGRDESGMGRDESAKGWDESAARAGWRRAVLSNRDEVDPPR
jgi:hypothetical protein